MAEEGDMFINIYIYIISEYKSSKYLETPDTKFSNQISLKKSILK